MKEWKTYKLSEIGQVIGGATPSTKVASNYDGDIAWITPKDLSLLSGRYIYKGERSITEAGYKSCSCQMLPAGSILFSSRAPIGYIAIAGNDLCTNQGFKSVVPNPEIVNSHFLYYLLSYEKNRIAEMGSGTTFMEISGNVMKNIEVKLPHLSIQNKIAEILTSLDEKIENNQRINDNLEQQAQALYKSWFVEFDPFKGGDFIDSEIGEIPAGWSIVKFGDITEIPKKTINPQRFPDSTFYHYSLPACDNGLIPEIQAGKDIMSNKIILQNNTTLFSKLNPRIKRIWFTCEVLPNSICSTEFIPFRAKDDNESSYIFSIVNSDAFYATVMGCVNGATGSHQRFHAEDTEDFLCPYNKDVVNEFSKLIEPILSQMHDLRHENVMLASTRDTLLPKLMSGELKINEIDG